MLSPSPGEKDGGCKTAAIVHTKTIARSSQRRFPRKLVVTGRFGVRFWEKERPSAERDAPGRGDDGQDPGDAPKPNLRVNSSAPRRTKTSTCGSSRLRSRTGAINPQVSGGGAAGKDSAGRKVSFGRQNGAREATLDVIPAKTSSPAPK